MEVKSKDQSNLGAATGQGHSHNSDIGEYKSNVVLGYPFKQMSANLDDTKELADTCFTFGPVYLNSNK